MQTKELHNRLFQAYYNNRHIIKEDYAHEYNLYLEYKVKWLMNKYEKKNSNKS